MKQITLNAEGTRAYCDDFAAGWRRHSLKDSLASTIDLENRNRRWDSNTTTGLTDGWKAREKATQ